jgi:hypothetical protein
MPSRRSGHSRPSVHDGHVHRIRARRPDRRVQRDARHLSSCVHLHRLEWPTYSRAARLTNSCSISRRNQRGFTGVDVRRHCSAWSCRAHRYNEPAKSESKRGAGSGFSHNRNRRGKPPTRSATAAGESYCDANRSSPATRARPRCIRSSPSRTPRYRRSTSTC